jgi:glycosyltransferase involved in cell wall biosynthesis
LKLLHIISGASPESGGPIQGIRNYHEASNLLGIDRTIICFENQSDLISWNFPESLKLIGLGNAKNLWQRNPALITWLKKHLLEYDCIVLNGIWTYHSYATLKVLRYFKKQKLNQKIPKIFLMPHGMLDPWFQKEKTRKIKAIRNIIYWHLIEKKVVNQVDAVLFTCDEEMLLAKKTFYGYKPKKEVNVGYGIQEPPQKNKIELEAFYNKFDINTSIPYFLFLSRIDFKKGVDLLLKAYNTILQESVDPNVIPNLVIAGSGFESEYGKGLLKYIEIYPLLKQKLCLTGLLNAEMKWAAIYGCEAFVLPSHQENFGIAVAEALACEKPVLITNKINIYREIEKGGGGIINEDTLTGTINNLKQWIALDAESKILMGKNAKKIYENNFKNEFAAQKLFDILNQ